MGNIHHVGTRVRVAGTSPATPLLAPVRSVARGARRSGVSEPYGITHLVTTPGGSNGGYVGRSLDRPVSRLAEDLSALRGAAARSASPRAGPSLVLRGVPTTGLPHPQGCGRQAVRDPLTSAAPVQPADVSAAPFLGSPPRRPLLRTGRPTHVVRKVVDAWLRSTGEMSESDTRSASRIFNEPMTTGWLEGLSPCSATGPTARSR